VRTGYGTDTVRKQFTGYERDGETGLDFAKARYFASSHGRFTSPDDFARDTVLADPQSLNKYGYVRNNPLRYVDPTGEKAQVTITYDEKKKRYVITVSASFGVYDESGTLSQEEINNQIALLKTQITNAYNARFSNGDFKFVLKTNITVRQFKSEAEAKAEGDKGRIDNIVGLVDGNTVMPGRQVKKERGQTCKSAIQAPRPSGADFFFLFSFSYYVVGGKNRRNPQNDELEGKSGIRPRSLIRITQQTRHFRRGKPAPPRKSETVSFFGAKKLTISPKKADQFFHNPCVRNVARARSLINTPESPR
jgi:RHS repeat-associated protein